jgi:hypothetical protein
LYVPLDTIDLVSATPPLRYRFQALATEEHSINFWFEAGSHTISEVQRRLNIGPKLGESVAADAIDFSWRITDATGQIVATGAFDRRVGGYGDGMDRFKPLWPYLHLRGGEDYTLEVSFDRRDQFIASLKPTVRITIDRGQWTDVYPLFPVLYPVAKVILGIGFFAMVVSIFCSMVTNKRKTEPVARANDHSCHGSC